MKTTRNPFFIYSVIGIFKTRPCVERNICFLEMSVFTKGITGKKRFIKPNGIKSSISKKSCGIEAWMFTKEIFPCWKQKFGIVNTFIFVRGIGFLFNNHIRMRRHKVFVIKRDMTDDTKTISNNAQFEGIAKCPLIYNCLISGFAETWEGIEA